MNKKLPLDAFTYYFSLGPGRSYQAVADKYGASKRAITSLAARENWQGRIAELERKAREKTDELALETLEDMNRRHLKVYRFIQNRAIETLKSVPLESAMDAVRAYERAAMGERLVRGEPTERSESTIEAVIKREYELCMLPAGGDGASAGGGSEAAEIEAPRDVAAAGAGPRVEVARSDGTA